MHHRNSDTQSTSKTRQRLRMQAVAVLSAIALCAGLLPYGIGVREASATPAEEKRAEAQAALESLNALQDQLDEASNNYYLAVEEQEAAQQKMDECQAAITAAEERISELQTKLSGRCRSMYRSGSSSLLDLLLGATSFREFATGWDLLNTISENDAAMVAETKELRATLEKDKEEYIKQKALADEKAKEAEDVKAAAEKLVAEMYATYSSLDEEATKLLEEERAIQEAAANNGYSGNSSGSSQSPGSYSDTPAAGSSYNASIANAVVNAAYSRLGCPYVWATHGPDTFDCSGLVYWCYQQAGISLSPASSYYLRFDEVEDPMPGDVCVRSGHVGIYIGDGRMIHAPTPGDVVCITTWMSGMWIVRPYA